jgi:hypothetical protein
MLLRVSFRHGYGLTYSTFTRPMIPGVKLIDDILRGLPDNARLREDVNKLAQQLETALAENERLKIENTKLRGDLEAISAREEALDPVEFQIIHLLFKEGPRSVPTIAKVVDLMMGEAEYHCGVLSERDLVTYTSILAGAELRLTQKGRSYYMKNR